jgi:hypothetical protein
MPPPRIYISHPDLSVEETARRVGVSKRRLKELMVIIADLNSSESSRGSRSTGKQRGNTQPKRTAKP